ncbi:aspartyl protease family protein [Nitrosomonas cryotolerans]|uniref:Aspartyl protease family protein n=1 Tax=Nitrosomonas cryotolerans ATCC 49181 TaxID=1131553 RepID=A0A1N6FHQ3_9PROT|nr:TIGR02281 family clan AA aspartic protease [Nitrosomonas cryotolerans]SFP62600.1 aspartyl protease family protein [Nitrosomonas cryotolerans]SIN94828.1 aspartyl protease family protein [Nitrosomonas cryotolerans ATCC 49181]
MNNYIPWGHISALVTWIAIFSVAYVYFEIRQEPMVAVAEEGLIPGEIVIPRSLDGHYYIRGSINGYPVDFMVDTGASVVSVNDHFSKKASLPSGTPVSLSTAGGIVTGEIISGQTVEAGGISIKGLSVSVGIQSEMALLGQNFLRRVDVIQSNDKMILRIRT